MTTNPFTEDPTVHATFAAGEWRANGRNLTTTGVTAAQQQLAGQIEQIRGRRELSAEAKRIAIARVYREARDSITAMRQEAEEQVRGERTKLHRKLFGYEGEADVQTVIARRDAADRASKLDDPHAAETALRKAEMHGDTHMAQAIAAHAQEQAWGTVLDTYVSSRPEAAATAEALHALPNPDDGMWRMEQAMTYSVMQPTELDGMPDYSVNALAASDLDVA